jgi:biotin carboxyl carrier protein
MKYVTLINGTRFEVEIDKDGRLLVNGEPRDVDFLQLGDSLYSVITQSQSYEIVIEEQEAGGYEVLMRGHLYAAEVLDERAQLLASRRGGGAAEGGEISIKSPMPGLIAAVLVEEGQQVTAGQTVVILESMKMQNELKTPREGTVQRVSVQVGQSVEQSRLLVTIV